MEAGYLKVMNQLDRTLAQIGEMEDEIYEDMRESENLERIRSHTSTSIMDVASLSGDDISLENYQLVKGLAQTKSEGSQAIRASETLRELLGARAVVMRAKSQV